MAHGRSPLDPCQSSPYSSLVRTAFKEWAIVVDALGRGDQILILRKGGIAEGRGGFQAEHPRFLFFPTLFHQQRESVLPAAQARYDEVAPHFPPPEVLRLELCAEVVAWRKLDSLAAVERLRGQHIWRDDVLAQRFEWGQTQNIFALAVRVSRLPHTSNCRCSPATPAANPGLNSPMKSRPTTHNPSCPKGPSKPAATSSSAPSPPDERPAPPSVQPRAVRD